MTAPAWHVEVTVDTVAGPLALSSGDVSDVDPFLEDGLTLSWSRDEGAAPGQPSAFEASFRVLAPGPAPLDIGRRVAVRLLDAPLGDEVAAMFGRVGDLDSSPVEYSLDDGLTTIKGQRFEVKCVDFTVDLAEVTSTTAALASSGPTARLNQYLIGAPDGPTPGEAGAYLSPGSPGPDSWVNVKAEDAASSPCLPRVLGLLDQVGLGYLGADAPLAPAEGVTTPLTARLAARAIFAPRVDPDTGDYHPAALWKIDAPPPYYDHDDPAAFPAVLDEGPDGWGLIIDESCPIVLPATQVEWGAKWVRNKTTDANRVTVTYTPAGATDEVSVSVDSSDRDVDDPVAALPLSAPLLGDVLGGYGFTHDHAPRRMAAMYLPEADASDRWVAQAFRYYPPDWSRLLFAPWFPRHHDVDETPNTAPGDPDTRAQCYSHPLVVSGIDPAHHPTGRTWYAGTLNAVTLTLAGARPVVEVTLRRVLPPAKGLGVLTPADVPEPNTVGALDPMFSVYDYRLARGA